MCGTSGPSHGLPQDIGENMQHVRSCRVCTGKAYRMRQHFPVLSLFQESLLDSLT